MCQHSGENRIGFVNKLTLQVSGDLDVKIAGNPLTLSFFFSFLVLCSE